MRQSKVCLVVATILLTLLPAVYSVDGDKPDDRGSLVRISFFAGVDGSTYAVDGSKFGLYREYLDREIVVKTTTADLERFVERLEHAGLLTEKDRALDGGFTMPPQAYDILVHWTKHDFKCRFYYRRACEVPGKYLDILDEVPQSWKTKGLSDFVSANREINRQERLSP